MVDDAKIAVCIKTSGVRPSLCTTVNAIRMNLHTGQYRIYLHDDGKNTPWKSELYKMLKNEGHIVCTSPKPVRSGVARNELLSCLQGERYLLRLDDDFELGGEFEIQNLIKPLEKYQNLAWVSNLEVQVGKGKSMSTGAYRPPGGSIKISQGKIVKRFHSRLRRYDDRSLKMNFCDFSRNLMLLKTDIVKAVKWDEEIIFSGEHLDFQMSLKNAGFRGAYVSNSKHYHRDDLTRFRHERPKNELVEKNRISRSRVFKTKWGTDVVKTSYPLDIKIFEIARRIYHIYWS